MIPLMGFLIAFVVGLTGIGAGAITVPVLILLFGEQPATAVSTTLIFSFIVRGLAIPIYLHRGHVEARALGALCLGGLPGIVGGMLILAVLDVHQHERTILLTIGVTIAGLAWYNMLRLAHAPSEFVGRDLREWLPWVAAVVGAEAGFSAAGTGALGSLILMSCTQLSPAQVVGTDLCFGLAISMFGGGGIT
jgi:uncharacterized protein